MQVTFNITRGHTIALFKVITLGLLLGFGIQFLFAWTAPTATAPAGNVDGPLTVSSDEQFKKGPLTINKDVLPSTIGSAYGLVVYENVLVAGKVRSLSTLAGDPGQTLVTKDYLDSKFSGTGGVATKAYVDSKSGFSKCHYVTYNSGVPKSAETITHPVYGKIAPVCPVKEMAISAMCPGAAGCLLFSGVLGRSGAVVFSAPSDQFGEAIPNNYQATLTCCPM